MINIREGHEIGSADADSGYTSGTQSAGTGMHPSHHQAAFSSGSYSQPATPVETPVAGPATRSRLPPPYELLEVRMSRTDSGSTYLRTGTLTAKRNFDRPITKSFDACV